MGRFKKGQSGNPAGKPKGCRARATIIAEQLIDEEGEAVVRSVIDAAKGGDMTAARIVVERLIPPRKDRPISFSAPQISDAASVTEAMGKLLASVAEGEITPMEAASVGKLVEAYVKSLETRDLEERIAILERRVTNEAD